eukprot:1427295-Pleurochrysis_carterae.AAC.1
MHVRVRARSQASVRPMAHTGARQSGTFKVNRRGVKLVYMASSKCICAKPCDGASACAHSQVHVQFPTWARVCVGACVRGR